MIKKTAKGYKVISHKSGKNLGGPYSSHAKAVKRIHQVQYFKHKRGK